MDTMPAKESEVPASFEHAIAELERIVAAMESGALPLEEALAQYERGVQLLKECRTRLDAAEQQIRILEGDTLVEYRDPAGSDEDAPAR